MAGPAPPQAARGSPGAGTSAGPRPVEREAAAEAGARARLAGAASPAGRGIPGRRAPLGAGAGAEQRTRPCAVSPGDSWRSWRARESRGERRGRRRAGWGRLAEKPLRASPQSPRRRLGAAAPGSATSLMVLFLFFSSLVFFVVVCLSVLGFWFCFVSVMFCFPRLTPACSRQCKTRDPLPLTAPAHSVHPAFFF